MRIQSRLGRLTLASLLVQGAIALPAAGADVVLQHVVLTHATVTMAITPPGHDSRPAASRPDSGGQLYRLTIVLRDIESATAISDAHVRVNVAEKGFAGTEYALAPDIVDGVPGYRGYVSMPTRTAYRILVHVMLPRVDRVLEAQFSYRYHH